MVWFRCQCHSVNPAVSEQDLNSHDQLWNQPDASNRAQRNWLKSCLFHPPSVQLLSALETMPVQLLLQLPLLAELSLFTASALGKSW